MAIRFGFSTAPKAKTYRTIVVQPNLPIRAILGFDKSFHRDMEVHYDPRTDRSSPCAQEDCKVCPRPKRQITYVPAWVFMGASLRFQERILMVTKTWRELLDHDLKQWMYLLKRERPDSNAPVTWACDTAIAGKLQPLRGFDIEASLWQMWGVRPPAQEA